MKNTCFRIYALFSYISVCLSQTTVTVNTNVGSIMGFKEYISVDGEQKLISKFLGIPYAESTAGQNRFRKPVPKAPFQSTFDARKVPMACYQQSKEDGDYWTQNNSVPGFSEDCLTLNVYIPHELQPTDMLPVMIWIYGGGFTTGVASLYNPEVLALFGNVIVVTINYRIGMFGFLRDSDGIFPGNQGLWDQHLAIKWVHDNIDKFYGYKDEITIFGESAGGASVLLQAIYPGNKGLFKRVIAESGTAISPWALLNIPDFEVYLNAIGCSPSSKTFVTCLQLKDPVTLQSNITSFGPVVDHDFLNDIPIEILKANSTDTADARNLFASLDIIVGVNDFDGTIQFSSFASLLDHADLEFNISRNEFSDKIIPFMVDQSFPRVKTNSTRTALENLLTFLYTSWENPDDYVAVRNHMGDLANDASFFAPAALTADIHAKSQRGKTYFYEFAVAIQTHILPVPSWMKGSAHFDEVPYVFGFPLSTKTSVFGRSNVSYTAEEKQVSRAIMAFWSNFAKSGNPNVPMDVTPFTKTTWPAYSMTSQRYFRMSNQMSPDSVLEGFYPRRMAFWSNIPYRIQKIGYH